MLKHFNKKSYKSKIALNIFYETKIEKKNSLTLYVSNI
jgi:hypothetical protein